MIADITTDVIEGGEPTAAVIARDGGLAHFIATDVCVTAQVEALVAHTVERFGRLDVLVNNARVRHARPLLELDDAHWQRLLDVNLTGVLRCFRAAVRQMVQQTPEGDVRGRIVNLSSQHGMIAAPGDLGYGTTKAAIDYMTRQIATDYAPHGIVCNAVAPARSRPARVAVRSIRRSSSAQTGARPGRVSATPTTWRAPSCSFVATCRPSRPAPH